MADWMRRHWLVTFGLSLIFPTGLFIYWALDRAPPFIQHHLDPIAPVHAGEEVTISADVERQHERHCAADVTRELLDANGVLHTPFVEKALLSATSIKEQDVRERNKLRRAFHLPDTLPSGPTTILTHLAYRCAGNPLHSLWPGPILIDLKWSFIVLPPAQKPAVVLPVVVAPVENKPKGTPDDPISVTVTPKAKP